MRFPMTPKALFTVPACMILAGLVICIGPKVDAQSPHGTFNELLRPYLNQTVSIVGASGNSYTPTTLKEIGFDYIMVDNPPGQTEAIPLTSIHDIKLGGQTPEIYLYRY